MLAALGHHVPPPNFGRIHLPGGARGGCSQEPHSSSTVTRSVFISGGPFDNINNRPTLLGKAD